MTISLASQPLRVPLLAVALCLFLASPAPPAAAGSEPRRPNIVMIFTDDQRADTLGSMGNALQSTPWIDRLAREGALFEHAFVVTSLCCPSRATVLTGQYGHVNGVARNGDDLAPRHAPFVPSLLQAAGYRTAFIGKYHMGGLEESALPREGFDFWAGIEGQGRHLSCPLNINGVPRKPSGYTSDVLAGLATRWLRRQKKNEQPFFLLLSLKSPHGPMIPARRHRRLFSRHRFAIPSSFHDGPETLPPPLRDMTMSARPFRRTEAELQQLLLEYARMIPAVDDAVGRVYETLLDMGELDRTLFVFSSDNGHLFGEHQIIAKGLAYDPSIRVPMVIRFPGLFSAGSRFAEQVLNLDVAPTLLQAAGLEAPEAMQGTSLAGLAGPRRHAWRRDWLYVSPSAWHGSPTHLAVRGSRWKYVRHRGEEIHEQLFDLAADPGERSNRLDETQVLAGMRARMRELMRELQAPERWWRPALEEPAVPEASAR